ncbi:PREDICTED: trafficking protein particle complex subunit 11 isoform X2 [Nelumbo nucifera]|uniref:Trafficking protein particle complex subunit 11 n=1 Tax=Nelumbo nucifera TaxID=4432 RepID=A0A1U8AVJ2_NELNU|nr:PREDICTED: trafficking protein particle complex subunit 11 isoform X2 [Nelumbo nucifera]
MEEYPEELRTPPVSLVSLVGCPELHSTISTYLHSEQPPINTLALPDFSKISVLSRSKKETLDSGQPGGILKRDWLLKHRTRSPAVVAALFGSDDVSGDPAQWLQVCTELENLKAVVRGRNIKLTVVVVQSFDKDEVSEDRMIALRKRAEIDSKYLLTFVQKSSSDLKHSLNRLGSIVAELANTYYRDEGRRVKTCIEKKSFSSVDLNIRYCFKVAVYAEFRRDWGEALRFYEDAYRALRELAAHYLREKKCCLELALSASEAVAEIESSADSVIPSVYVGQFARLLEQGDALVMQNLTDAEYVLYALAEGKRFQDSFEIIALLKKSFESYSNLKAQRMASYCSCQMAREYFSVGKFDNAKELFDGVASLYRKEGWTTLLWDVLGYLRECSKRLGSVKDFIEYSLEMAALPISSGDEVQSPIHKGEYGPAGCASLPQRERIYSEVFGIMKGESGLTSNEGNVTLNVTPERPIRLEIDLVSPLRVAFLASVAFHDQVAKPGASIFFTLSLISQLPQPVEIDQLEVKFNQSECNFTIASAQKAPISATSIGKTGARVVTAPVLTVVTNKWLRLTYDVTSELSGKLECKSVIARLGPLFTICCQAESPASMNDLPLWKFEDHVETFPTRDPALAFSGQKFIQVDEPDPQVDLVLGASGPALVGERFMLPVTIVSKGHEIHSGELKINLVDARRGAALGSPREMEPISTDSLHVELLGVSRPDGDDEPQTGQDNIWKIQHSFGLLSVPFVNLGGSWSCKLEIKWHRPKPVMLYVSLGYLPTSNGSTIQKVHAHKSLQIEGKTAIMIGHRFMLPFRRNPLLLSKIKVAPNSNQSTTLALNETSILIVSAKNCTEVPLRLVSMSIEMDENDIGKSCTVRQRDESQKDHALLVPGEEFRKVFSVIPKIHSPNLAMGTVCFTWKRDSGLDKQSDSNITEAGIITRHKLPDVNVEMAPLVVSLECPPHTILGIPFTCYVKIQNQTEFLQEVKYLIADSQSFLLSGSHNDMVSVLPKSEHILGYKLVPLASGSQQLPRITVTAVRYSAELSLPQATSTVFVFPSEPHFKMGNLKEKVTEIVTTGA